MKRVRAAFALLFQLLLLQASALGGGMACSPAWTGMLSASPATSSGTTAHAPATHVGVASHGGHVQGADHAAHGAPREVSAGVPADAPMHGPMSDHGGMPVHCATIAGCAAVAVAAPVLALATVTAVHDSVQVGRVLLPPSTHLAPEPPPPRA